MVCGACNSAPGRRDVLMVDQIINVYCDVSGVLCVQVTEWHAKYVAEVVRLFDKYKEKAGPDYANKKLEFADEVA